MSDILQFFIVLGIFFIGLPIIVITSVLFIYKKINTDKDTVKEKEYLSFDEVNDIIDYMINEITVNKWKVYYRLKEISVIPKMQDDITDITKEIISSFSPSFLESVEQYYTREFFYTLITRRVQVFLINYTNEYKPNAK